MDEGQSDRAHAGTEITNAFDRPPRPREAGEQEGVRVDPIARAARWLIEMHG